MIVSGSSQDSGQSLKVSRYLEAYLEDNLIKADVVDLYSLNLPLIGHQSTSNWHKRWQAVEKQLQTANGVILVSPEYNGGPSPALLNMMFYVQDQLRHKPALLVGVSSGRGGAAPILGLQQFGVKDTGYVIIPGSVIVSNVGSVLNDHSFSDEAELKEEDSRIRKRLAKSLLTLLAYAQSLEKINQALESE